MPYYIYTLVDPRTNLARYVGITNNTALRLKQHLSEFSGSREKIDWLNELKQANYEPIMRVIEIVNTPEEARDRENYWIAYHLDNGYKLVNSRVVSTYYQKPIHQKSKDVREIHSSLEQVWKGYYSAAVARKKLGVSMWTFKCLIKNGKVQRIQLPMQKHGIFQKSEIDKLVADIASN